MKVKPFDVKSGMYVDFDLENDNKDSKVELDLSNCATKSDLKGAAGMNTSEFARKTDLASLRSDIYI